MNKLLVLILSTFILMACSTTQKKMRMEKYTSTDCLYIFEAAESKAGDGQLDSVSELFRNSCYKEVINLGGYLRKFRRDKFYQLTNEAAELLTPEGTFTEYVMESHERAFLTILISLSYLHLGDENSSQVELRKTYEEHKAELFNFGQDPLINLMLAVLWDRWDSSLSRPFWKSLSQNKTLEAPLQNFATTRIKEIDAFPTQTIAWKILGFGNQPDVEWQSQIFNLKNNPYKITPRETFPANCTDKDSLVFNSRSWLEKLNSKYSSDYHPTVFAKSLLRFPVGLTYGLVGVTSGVALGVGGCVVAAKAESADLCESSIKVAGKLIGSSVDFVDYTLRPDMRRWRQLPSVFIFIRPTYGPVINDFASPCTTKFIETKPTLKLIEY